MVFEAFILCVYLGVSLLGCRALLRLYRSRQCGWGYAAYMAGSFLIPGLLTWIVVSFSPVSQSWHRDLQWLPFLCVALYVAAYAIVGVPCGLLGIAGMAVWRWWHDTGKGSQILGCGRHGQSPPLQPPIPFCKDSNEKCILIVLMLAGLGPAVALIFSFGYFVCVR